MNQKVIDDLRLLVIEKCKNEISILEKKRDNIEAEIEIQKENLIAYQKIIPIVEIKN